MEGNDYNQFCFQFTEMLETLNSVIFTCQNIVVPISL